MFPLSLIFLIHWLCKPSCLVPLLRPSEDEVVTFFFLVLEYPQLRPYLKPKYVVKM